MEKDIGFCRTCCRPVNNDDDSVRLEFLVRYGTPPNRNERAGRGWQHLNPVVDAIEKEGQVHEVVICNGDPDMRNRIKQKPEYQSAYRTLSGTEIASE